MKAIALTPGTTTLQLVDRPEPSVTAPDEVKLQILEVGICGTDREEASGGRAEPPSGQTELVIGHEMFGRVVEVGQAVKTVRRDDYAVFTVRRECGHCPACDVSRSDMCYSGDYVERGIKGRDGYQAEYVVDHERYVVRIPEGIASIGVLTEPMSVVEKAFAARSCNSLRKVGWEADTLFFTPMVAWHQHVNADQTRPVHYLEITTYPS